MHPEEKENKNPSEQCIHQRRENARDVHEHGGDDEEERDVKGDTRVPRFIVGRDWLDGRANVLAEALVDGRRNAVEELVARPFVVCAEGVERDKRVDVPFWKSAELKIALDIKFPNKSQDNQNL